MIWWKILFSCINTHTHRGLATQWYISLCFDWTRLIEKNKTLYDCHCLVNPRCVTTTSTVQSVAREMPLSVFKAIKGLLCTRCVLLLPNSLTISSSECFISQPCCCLIIFLDWLFQIVLIFSVLGEFLFCGHIPPPCLSHFMLHCMVLNFGFVLFFFFYLSIPFPSIPSPTLSFTNN